MVVFLDLFSLDAFLDGMKINYHYKKGFVRYCATDSDEDIGGGNRKQRCIGSANLVCGRMRRILDSSTTASIKLAGNPSTFCLRKVRRRVSSIHHGYLYIQLFPCLQHLIIVPMQVVTVLRCATACVHTPNRGEQAGADLYLKLTSQNGLRTLLYDGNMTTLCMTRLLQPSAALHSLHRYSTFLASYTV